MSRPQLCLVPSCDQSSTWGYLCANGRTGHAVGVALVLSDAPFNLKLAITVTRVLPIPCVLFTCRSLHWSLDPCLGFVVRPVDVTHIHRWQASLSALFLGCCG